MKTRHRFSPFLGVQRRFLLSVELLHQSKTIKSWSRSGVIGGTLGVSGRRDAEEVEGEGTKTRAERNDKGSPTNLNHRPSHIIFWIKMGAPSVIGFLNYFLKGEFRHVRTQQLSSLILCDFTTLFDKLRLAGPGSYEWHFLSMPVRMSRSHGQSINQLVHLDGLDTITLCQGALAN